MVETAILDWPLYTRKKGKTKSEGGPSKLGNKDETEAGVFRPKIKAEASGTKREEAEEIVTTAIEKTLSTAGEIIPVSVDVEVTKEIATTPVEEPLSATGEIDYRT
ncbi:hypothetical protein PTKIN_Ptkin09bG0277500 [Pterospermum kingtungense]